MFKKLLFVAVCLLTLVGLFYAVENWRGKHAWETYRHAREAKGDSFEWSALAPKPVPDAENFAAIPLFAELFPKPPAHPQLSAIKWPDCPKAGGNWHEARLENLAAWRNCLGNENLLAALAQYDPILNAITAASHRPKCRFPIRYDDHVNALLPHLSHLRTLARAYRLRALAALATGNPDVALADVQTNVRLAGFIKEEPVLISFLVHNAILDIAVQPVWEGLATHRWSDAQLTALQTEFEQVDEFDIFAKAMRGERMFAISAIRWVMEKPSERLAAMSGMESGQPVPLSNKLVGWCIPSGWFHQNMLSVDRFYTETYLPAIDFEHRVIKPASTGKIDATICAMRTSPYNIFFCKLLVPAVASIGKKTAQSQTTVDEATVACALERYRLATGELPENLAALVPQYLRRLPVDVITGELLHYRRTAPDQFLLYSVGWNGTDDNGEIAFNGSGRARHQNFDQGDWVWSSQPAAIAPK